MTFIHKFTITSSTIMHLDSFLKDDQCLPTRKLTHFHFSHSGQLYNTLQAEFVKSQYKPRWTDSTIEMISEASQTDFQNLPEGLPYDHKQGWVF